MAGVHHLLGRRLLPEGEGAYPDYAGAGVLAGQIGATITFLATAVTTLFMGYLWWYLLRWCRPPSLSIHIRNAHQYAALDSPDAHADWRGLLFSAAFCNNRQNLRAIGSGEEVI